MKGKAGVVSPVQSLIRIFFLAYCALMLWLLFGQRMNGTPLDICLDGSGENINLIPFETVRLYWRLLQKGASAELLHHAVINLVGNVVMFVPLGWFLPAISGKFRGVFRATAFAVLLIALVEAVQYITGLGSCDIDDLILNLFGMLLGYLLFIIFKK
jgi:glycopeptide antibiotics resistance protein